MKRVLIIGGCGRIGRSIASDILTHTDAEVTITGRSPQRGMAMQARLGEEVRFQVLDLAHPQQLREAVTHVNLVVHAAGPFHYREASVLKTCIEEGVDYVDVSDDRSFTRRALTQYDAAKAAGITAVINTGVFPGLSNSMARQAVEALDQVDSIQLSYIVAGSGGAGVTIMRTTFIGLQHPYDAWIDGAWTSVKPYTARETREFPPPYGQAYVYWYDVPEAMTLKDSFSVKTVITKFGIIPDFYNHATWLVAHGLPAPLLRHPNTVEWLAQISYWMTRITDRMSGIGVSIRCDAEGTKAGVATHYTSTFAHDSTAIAAGQGTGGVAELILTGKLHQPGVYPVEQALPTDLFRWVLGDRQLQVNEVIV